MDDYGTNRLVEDTILIVLEQILITKNTNLSYRQREKLVAQLFNNDELRAKHKGFSGAYMRALNCLNQKDYKFINKCIDFKNDN